MRVVLDMEDTLIVPLPRLRLGQVLGQQRDRPHNSSRDIDLGGGQDLRTLLEMRKIRIKKLSRDWKRKKELSVGCRLGWTECSGRAAGEMEDFIPSPMIEKVQTQYSLDKLKG